MANIQFSIQNFRALYAGFQNPGQYSDATITANNTAAISYVSNVNSGCGILKPAQQAQAINLMTAHLMALNDMITQGQTPGIVTSASIDKISVSVEPPPAKNQWQYWLNLTPYGSQLLALLSFASVGGIYVGGRPEISGLRKGAGWF